jgi:hypothetical protein
MLSAKEIEDLTQRCKYAKVHGFKVALAEEYARELGYRGEAPPPKVAKFSAAHLLHLLGNLRVPETQRAPDMTKASKPAKKSPPPPKEKAAPKEVPAPVVAPPAPDAPEDILAGFGEET